MIVFYDFTDSDEITATLTLHMSPWQAVQLASQLLYAALVARKNNTDQAVVQMHGDMKVIDTREA